MHLENILGVHVCERGEWVLSSPSPRPPKLSLVFFVFLKPAVLTQKGILKLGNGGASSPTTPTQQSHRGAWVEGPVSTLSGECHLLLPP